MDASTPLSTGGFQYRNDVLEFFPHAEGYVQATQSGSIGGGTQLSFHYVYNYTDHTSTPLSTGLGNIRLKYTTHPQTGEIRILEENHYYPYGLTHKGYSEKHSTFAEGPGGGITLIPVTPDVRDPYKYKFGRKEYQEEFDVNVYDFGARNYDATLGRWMNVDPLAMIYNQHSSYNYTLNNPIYFKDPDGKRVIVSDEETRNIILEYITEQLGENHGFSFNKKGELRYKNKDLKKASKGFNDEQISIASGLKEVIDGENVIEVHINTDNDQFSVDIYEPGYVFDQEGKYVPDGQGGFKREGWQKTKYIQDLNTKEHGGALFYEPGNLFKANSLAYAHLAINRKTASTIQLQGVGGKLTTPSESSVFIHEILDHGLDFIKNGNINKSSGQGVENVKFHNQALKNISNGESPLRNTHYD